MVVVIMVVVHMDWVGNVFVDGNMNLLVDGNVLHDRYMDLLNMVMSVMICGNVNDDMFAARMKEGIVFCIRDNLVTKLYEY